MSRILSAVPVVLCLSFHLQAQEASGPSLITVNGQAEVRVVPDEVLLSLGVETTDKLLAVAKNENDKRISRVLALIKTFGVDPKHFQTDFISIEPWYRRGSEYPESLEYRVRKTIIITLKETGKFETLVSEGLEAGITHVHFIQFRTTELRKHRDQARSLAMRAAREKATELASVLGQRIGLAHRINEHGSGWFSPYGFGWGNRWGGQGMTQNVVQSAGGSPEDGDGTFALGQITVTANVTVSFQLK